MLSTPDIKAQLERPYRRSEWIALLNAVFNGEALRTEWEARPHDEPLSTKAAEYCARSITSLGRITLADRKVVAVYECEVNRATISEMRVGLRRLMRDKIIPGIHDAVFAVFHSPQQQEWRFTFVSKHEAIDEESGGTINVETAPKRYTYVLGPTQTCRTAAERFATLQAQATLKKVEDAFKVAPLFKEFYRDYHQVFKRTKELVLPQFPKGEAGKDPAQLFVQRLFNRLMFLAFIQRKGWLTINGGKEYLAALHRSYRKGSGTNFYRDILRPLFFEGLNQDERPPGHTDPRFGQVPYLNGGLFEKAVDTSDDRITEIPDEAFTDILHPDHGLFSRYNFTASENTPLDVEVAVDPEMLGKVFEELVTGRHEQGSYYTPKPIVSFMGRAALVEYLADVCTREQRDALEAFVHEHKADSLRDPEAVLDALRKVTVCDPACGSGAYLLGMLHELLELRDCLFKSNQKLDPNSNYERKLSIIERNLYGVDKDDFAVNIARLRLWLSLAVDFQGEVPPPLPNLDFKIETGDSLAAPAPLDVMRDFPAITGLVHRFTELKRKHLRAHGEEADALEAEIKAVKAELRSWLGAEGPPDAFQWAIEFAEVFLTEEAHSTVSGALNLGHELAPPPQEGGFDIIVANPPYVRMELIKPQKPILRKRFPQVHAERADLYVYFYARAHELLRKGGVAAFISTNKWLRSGFGEPLRRMLLDGQAFHTVMDFGDLPVFETATAYPCIFVWQKVARGETPTHWTTVRDLASCYAEGVREHFLKNSVAVPADLFGPGKPRLATTATAGLKAKMEGSGQPLGEVVNGVLGWGVKTGLNKAFIINRSIREQLVKESKAAAEVIKPLIEGEDVRRYELFDRGSYLIYTHHGIDIKKYPSIEEHLRPFRSFKDKKGKTVGLDHRATKQAWYELQQPQYAYKEYFAKPKIIYPDIGKELRFVVDEKGYFGANTTYFLPLADWYLCAVLNSSSVRQWIQKSLNDIRGGYLRFFGQHMEQLPIPDASAADRKVVGDLAKQAQTLHGERRAKVEAFLRALGIDPAESNSRNPLEQPWNLVEAEFTKRSKKLKVPLREAHQHYEQAREETAALTERIMNVEREIDERVATLYGLDAEDQRWAAKSTPTARPDDKGTLLFKVLGDLKAKAPYFSYKAIQAAVNEAELGLKDASLRSYLSRAVEQKLIHDAGRGWYSRLGEPVRLDPKPLRPLIKAIEKAFPLLDFAVWSTGQLNPWMHHLIARPVLFVNVAEEAVESVADKLADQGWNVLADPSREEGSKRLQPGERMVVVRRALQRAPAPDGRQARLEQILVDVQVEAGQLPIMDRHEAARIAQEGLQSGLLQVSELQRYANSRKVDIGGFQLIN